MQNKISIITPAYNSERFIHRCVESVKAQSYHCYEHIVVDDGSTDNTAIVAQNSGTVTVIRTKNGGAASARNIGLENATGSYIKFLDADDLLHPRCLEFQIEKATEKADNLISVGNHQVLRGGELVDKQLSWQRISRSNISDLLMNNILTSTPLFPAVALKAVGGFTTNLFAMQEWNLCLKLVMAGFEFSADDIMTYTLTDTNANNRISDRRINFEDELVNFRRAVAPVAPIPDREIDGALSHILYRMALSCLRQSDFSSGAKFYSLSNNVGRFWGRKTSFKKSMKQTAREVRGLGRASIRGIIS